ncbi:replication initiation factor domain-containing protein [Methylobacter tundripaludum]|uniref:replication initiation factor domain-containing protein n=1 Tax=Methylobacter tundripaludum TaxID=173365 RepID=UPI00068A7425|nr:replication initiation factor domain-containing protein [Methylobacter tundripaludum]
MDNFLSLPKRLRDKILPPKKLSPAEQLRKMRLECSVFPIQYKSAASLASHERKRLASHDSGAALAPPLLTGGESIAKADKRLPSFQSLETLNIVSAGHRGKFQFVSIPKPDKGRSIRHSFLDWITFTFKTGNLPLTLHSNEPAISDFDYVAMLSAQLYDVFGYGVTAQRLAGLNFYTHSFDLGHNGWGFVCIGGQNETCSVTVKGQGLLAAKPGWERRLFDFMNQIPESRLTRVDLANDNFNSKVSLDDYMEMYKADLFTSRGRPPNVEQAGNWVNPNGKGRTLYIGARKSGKLLRIYEKGLQLANGFHEKFPNWVRVELELKNQDRTIPLDVLLRPGQYLAGAYPALANMHKVQDVIKTAKKTVQSTFERSLETTRHQFGKHIWTQVQILGPDEAIRILTAGKEQIPSSLNFDTFDQYQENTYLHTDRHLLPPPQQLLEIQACA